MLAGITRASQILVQEPRLLQWAIFRIAGSEDKAAAGI